MNLLIKALKIILSKAKKLLNVSGNNNSWKSVGKKIRFHPPHPCHPRAIF